MKNIAVLFSLLIFGVTVVSPAFAQRTPSAFAAVPAPGQPVSPVAPTPTPTPVTPQAPLVPRPATPTAPAKQEEQLRIVADPATNSLIIYSTAQEFQNIKNILKDLDIIPRQVLMDVLVAEVTLTNTDSLGVVYQIFGGNHTIFGNNFPAQGAVVSPVQPATNPLATIVSGIATGFPLGISGIAGRGNAIRAFINALATENRLRTLASPSVLASDNRPARIQVGSEIPILTGQTTTFTAGTSPLTSNAIQYRNTGVILTIIPQVNSQGLVHLQVKQEVSSVGAQSFGSTGSPSFLTRDAETTAVVQDGETLIIGGIIQEDKSRDRSGIPYLMDLPVFGRFFGTTADRTERTELIILITPHVVRNKDEARDVTEEFKSKVSAVRSELESLDRERARDRAKQPQPQAVKPDTAPAMPLPSPAAPVPMPSPGAPGPAPGPIPGVSMAPANSTSVSSQRVASIMPPIKATGVKPTAEPEFRIEANSIAGGTVVQSREAPPQTYATETDAVGDLLKAIETNAPESPETVKPAPPTIKPAQVWVVQVASFVTDKEAQALANKLRGKGYDANIATAEVSGKTWYRVEVGRLASRNDARELQKNLQATEKIEQSIISGR